MADEEPPSPRLFPSEEDQEQTEREQRESQRFKRDATKARARHSDVLSRLVTDELKDEPLVSARDAQRLERWMNQKNCYHSNLYQVLLEYEITDPGKIEKVSPKMLKTVIREAKTEFVFVDGIDDAVRTFRQVWRKRVERASTKSPSRSPRSQPKSVSRNGSVRGNAPPVQNGQGLDLRRWLKQKDVWQIELWEILVEKGFQSGEDVANCSRRDFDRLIKDTKLQYNRQVSSGMQRGRFNKNLEKFIKLYRKIAPKATLLDEQTIAEAPRIHSASRRQNLPSAPELKAYLRAQEIWNVDLFKELCEVGVTTPDQLLDTPEQTLRECEDRVRVAKMKEQSTLRMRELLDKVLTKFHVHWQRNNTVEYQEDDGEYYEDDEDDENYNDDE